MLGTNAPRQNAATARLLFWHNSHMLGGEAGPLAGSTPSASSSALGPDKMRLKTIMVSVYLVFDVVFAVVTFARLCRTLWVSRHYKEASQPLLNRQGATTKFQLPTMDLKPKIAYFTMTSATCFSLCHSFTSVRFQQQATTRNLGG